jgi:hypothetical protein
MYRCLFRYTGNQLRGNQAACRIMNGYQFCGWIDRIKATFG